MKRADKIVLQGMKFYGYHGVEPAEKVLGQLFAVDVEIWGDFTEAALKDEIGAALDYSRVYEKVKDIVEGSSCHLIERLAFLIIEQLLSIPLAQKVFVRVKKPQAPLGGLLDYAAVEMERSKDED